jgi:hypothetical protein
MYCTTVEAGSKKSQLLQYLRSNYLWALWQQIYLYQEIQLKTSESI